MAQVHPGALVGTSVSHQTSRFYATVWESIIFLFNDSKLHFV